MSNVQLSFEGGNSRSHYVESSLWKRLWACLRQNTEWMSVQLRANSREFTAHSSLSHCCSIRLVFILTYICSQQSTRQAMYVSRSTDARSCIRWFGGKAVSIAYVDVCVCSLRYPACNTHGHIVVCGLSGSSMFFHIISRFSKKNFNVRCMFWFSL
jgi:hypothetical protein